MEKEVFPRIDLFPRITRVADGIKKALRLGRTTEICLSEHIQDQPEQLQLEFGE